MARVYNELVLHLTKEQILVDTSDTVGNEHLMIDRRSGEVAHINKPFPDHPIWDCETRRVCGLLGIIPLPSGPFLLVATDRVLVGTLFEKKIFQLGAVELIPIASDHWWDRIQDIYCRQAVLNLLKEPYYYFSYDYHLTHSLQRIDGIKQKLGLYGDADRRFVWNDALLRDWYRPEMRNFCLPLMHGFISIDMLDPVLYPLLRDHRPLGLALISRRSRERAGTRLFTRGIDTEGHVANFVESEQIFLFGDLCISYVQTRGSIPLFWTQAPNLRFRPRPRLDPDADHLNACRKHLTDQCARYGKVLLIDLVDRSVEAEAELGRLYESIIEQVANPDVVYARKEIFRLDVDWDDLNGYMGCIIDGFKSVLTFQQQDRVIRASCIDCIDRTNVFQSRKATCVCTKALFDLGIVRDYDDRLIGIIQKLCKTTWIENANVLSRQYTGSNALKIDLTFRQYNSIMGYLRDATYSLRRYYQNNFNDGERQRAIDFFLRVPLISDQRSRGVQRIVPQRPGDWFVVFSLVGIAMSQLGCPLGRIFSLFMIVYIMVNHPYVYIKMPMLEYRMLEVGLEDEE